MPKGYNKGQSYIVSYRDKKGEISTLTDMIYLGQSKDGVWDYFMWYYHGEYIKINNGYMFRNNIPLKIVRITSI